MTTSNIQSRDAKIQQYEDRGLKPSGSKIVTARNKKIRRDEYSGLEAEGTIARIGQFAQGVVKTVSTSFVGLKDPKVTDLYKSAIHGKVTEHVDTELPEPELTVDQKQTRRDMETAKWGYSPRSRSSIREYIKKPEIRRDLRSDGNGNYFLPENRCKGQSRFIFVPKGVFEDAKMVNYNKASTGLALTESSQQLRAIRTYGATIEDIDEQWDSKKAKEVAINIIKKENRDANKNPGDPGYIDWKDETALKPYIDRVKERRGSVTIDVQNKEARVYDKETDLNTSMSSFMTGTSISLNKESGKSVDRIHGKDMKNEEPLGGERPFADPLPAKGKPKPTTGTPTSRSSSPQGATVTDLDSDD